jgi:competence protein ComEA
MDKMINLGAKGTEKDFGTVLDYLAAHYPADEVPRINVNKCRPIDLESGLSLKRSEAAAIIDYRTKNGPFKSLADLKKVPGIDAGKIEAKKDRLAF